MTDREKVLRLGEYIIRLRQQIIVYEGTFMEYRVDTPYGRREIPFREDSRRIAQEDALKQIESELQDGLHQVIGQQNEPSALIQELCSFFLDGESPLPVHTS